MTPVGTWFLAVSGWGAVSSLLGTEKDQCFTRQL